MMNIKGQFINEIISLKKQNKKQKNLIKKLKKTIKELKQSNEDLRNPPPLFG